MTFSDKVKTFSQYRISLCRTALLLSGGQPLPLPFGKLFHQGLQLLVILYRLAHTVFPSFRHVQLTRLALLALHQIEGDMGLTARAATAGFSTRQTPDRERSAKQLAGVSQLGYARAAAAFRRGDTCPAQGELLSYIEHIYKNLKDVKPKN